MGQTEDAAWPLSHHRCSGHLGKEQACLCHLPSSQSGHFALCPLPDWRESSAFLLLRSEAAEIHCQRFNGDAEQDRKVKPASEKPHHGSVTLFLLLPGFCLKLTMNWPFCQELTAGVGMW